jgi:hypothetical protein
MVTKYRLVIGVLLIFFFLSLGFLIFLELKYFYELPKYPDVLLGRLNKVVIAHGSVRYAKAEEISLLQLGRRSAIVGAFLGFAAGVLNVFTPKPGRAGH